MKLNYNLLYAQLNKILTRAGVKHLFGVKTPFNKASPLSTAITSKGKYIYIFRGRIRVATKSKAYKLTSEVRLSNASDALKSLYN